MKRQSKAGAALRAGVRRSELHPTDRTRGLTNMGVRVQAPYQPKEKVLRGAPRVVLTNFSTGQQHNSYRKERECRENTTL